MSANREPEYDDPLDGCTSPTAITEELAWGSPEDERSPAGERSVIDLAEDQGSPRRRAPRPAVAWPGRGGPSWITVLAAAVLSGCVGAAITVALTRAEPRRQDLRQSGTVARQLASRRTRRHGPRAARMTHAQHKIAPANRESERHTPPRLAANTPTASLPISTVASAPPAPRRPPADTEGQVPGGPFSP
jgi:hypothetical protein